MNLQSQSHDGVLRKDEVAGSLLPHNLTLLPTYKCTAACEHCCFQSNPSITARVPQERLLDYIDQAAALGTMHVVCISGGEPFVIGNDLVELVRRCNDHGLLSRVVSNASFATTDANARKRIGDVVRAGLNEINFSTGDDHAVFVPLDNIIRALSVALEFGLTTVLMIEDKVGRSVTRDKVFEAAKSNQILHTAMQDGSVCVVESPWMEFREGGATIDQPKHKLLNRHNVAFKMPCKSVLTTMVVTPSEQLAVCCGLPREGIKQLHAGSLRDQSMRMLVDGALTNFMNIWLFVEGPEKILAWAASKTQDIEWEDLYAHNCDACRAIFKDTRVMEVIVEHWQEKYDEVLMKYALFQLEPDNDLALSLEAT